MLDHVKTQLKSKWEELTPQKQQRLLAGTFGGGSFLMIGALFISLLTPSKAKEDKAQNQPHDIKLQTAKDSTDPNLSWRQQIEADQKAMSRKLDEFLQGKPQDKGQNLHQDIEAIKKEVTTLQTQLHEQVLVKVSKGQESASSPGEGEGPAGEVLDVKPFSQETVHPQEGQEPQAFSNTPLMSPTPVSFPPSANFGGVEGMMPQGVVKFVVSRKEGAKRVKSTVENTVPSGTFARAVIMGGVDASTSVQASGDPRPVLLRVVDKGTLPRQFKSDLKQCHILASAYGDLSSERVLMRMEKLSCVEELTGEISESKVSGYIAGEDGRAGVRGVLVDKAGAQLRNAFVGGFFGGMGEFLTQSMRGQSMSMTPLGQVTQLNPLSKGEIFKAGSGKGLSSAFEKFSDFYIKRAEQLQPVLQVAAGRIVDIVFTDRASFEATDVRETMSSLREVSRNEAVKNLESQGDDMKNWLPSPLTQHPQSS